MGLGSRKSLGSSFDMKTHLYFGFFLRFALIMYGEHHDKVSVTKYTDIDYHVFTDAAREVTLGKSPYNRHTYRYTPFLAFLLIPNVKYSFIFGKFLFSCLDILASRLIYRILIYEGHSKKRSTSASLLWLYNPLVVAISTRGNADSLVAILTLVLVYFLKIRLPILSGIVLGIAIHFKLYPVIYILPIYISFTHRPEVCSIFRKFALNINKVRFIGGIVLSFGFLTSVSYLLYGNEYIEESFLYHVKRIDTRHNFSVYFYLLYLYAGSTFPALSIATFVPQAVLTFAFGFKYSSYRDLTFAMFTQTSAFVIFNKVVTSQYFVWYLALLPLVSTRLNFSYKKTLVLFALWLCAQASWLFPAYLLEFECMNTFVPIWLEGIAFFCCNIGILLACVSSYTQVLITQYSAKKIR